VELAELRARAAALETENTDLVIELTKLATERGHPAPGGEVCRRGEELVSRCQFVADHRHALEVKRLCEIVQIARSSFSAWLGAAPTRAARAAADA